MTTRPDADAALALLRGEFPEPWALSLRGGGGGRWYATAQTPNWPGGDESGIPGGFVTIDAKGESRDAAARALIAARDAAFPAQGWRECADELANDLLKLRRWVSEFSISRCGNELGEDYSRCNECDESEWGHVEDDGDLDDFEHGESCVLHSSALARYDALRKETERG